VCVNISSPIWGPRVRGERAYVSPERLVFILSLASVTDISTEISERRLTVARCRVVVIVCRFTDKGNAATDWPAFLTLGAVRSSISRKRPNIEDAPVASRVPRQRLKRQREKWLDCEKSVLVT